MMMTNNHGSPILTPTRFYWLLVLSLCCNTKQMQAFPVIPFQGQQQKPHVSVSSSRIALSMGRDGGVFNRIGRVSQANVNSVLQSWEKPEKVVDQAVRDMENDLLRIRQSYAEITAQQRRLQRERNSLKNTAAQWYQRAQLALKAGKEDLAKEALGRRQLYVERAENIDTQLRPVQTAAEKLYDNTQELQQAIRTARSRKEQIIARARTARSTKEVNDMLSGLSGGSGMEAFDRMEDKVKALEAVAKASAEMVPNSLPSTEAEFKALEAAASVDDELQQLKQNLFLAPGVGESVHTPSHTTTTNFM